ncbi:MAG TPA: ABC transporter permease subunit [Terriglobales bacterium]|nr:ABC transporter permease subunit [Terriglobales bacterium]
MTGMWAIIRKEWKSFFVTPAAYVVLALFAVISGFFFYSMLAMFVMQSLGGGMFGRGGLDAQSMLLQPFFFDVAILLLFLLPMITMRLYAEEARTGTLELLKTAPVRRMEVVLGKFLAAFGLVILLLLITGLYVGIVAHFAKLGIKPVSAGFLGLAMLGAAFLALGLFISSLTRNQIVAAVGTFSLFLLLWVADWVTSYGSGRFAELFSYLSITSHFRNFAQGVLDTKDIVYYLSLIVGGLFLTARRMELAE